MKKLIIQVAKRLLPRKMKRNLYRLAFHVDPDEAQYFASHHLQAPAMNYGLTFLHGAGFQPNTIIDIGAFRGDWSRLAAAIWPNARLIMFEPNASREQQCLETALELGASLQEKLLGAADGEPVNFNVMESGSSVFPEQSSYDRESEPRVLSTLDSCVGQFDEPVFLKIDAQGYELEILRGGRKTLERAAAVLLEVAILELNEGAPLAHDVVSFMKEYGFVVYDIVEIHRRHTDHALFQVDIVFVPENSPLRSGRLFQP